jgi:hypothetical protein
MHLSYIAQAIRLSPAFEDMDAGDARIISWSDTEGRIDCGSL